MANVRIVTDSTADLPKDVCDALNIEVVPLNVHFGEDVYKDQVELTSDRFFAMLTSRQDVVATTSQPSPEDFAAVYRRLHEDGAEIVSIHISQKISGTVQSAHLAAGMVPEAGVHAFDSELVSAALGHIVIACAEAAAAGASAQDVLAIAERTRAQTNLFGAIGTLDYLQRGGRIGRAQALVGSLLNIKPVITFADGVVTPAAKVRGSKRVIPELTRLVAEAVQGRPFDVTVLYGKEPDGVDALAAALQETGLVRRLRTGQLGPVVGCHAGPDVLGLAYSIVSE